MKTRRGRKQKTGRGGWRIDRSVCQPTFPFILTSSPRPRPNLNKAISTGCRKRKKGRRKEGRRGEFIRMGGVTSTSGIVRLAHMEGTKLSPRDNRESLSSLVIRGPTFPYYARERAFFPPLPSPPSPLGPSALSPPRNGFIQASSPPSLLLLLRHR